MKQPLAIEIFGQTYRFETEYDETQAKAVRDLLVGEIKKVEGHHSGRMHQISKFAVLMSAALNIANENIQIRRHESAFLKEIHQRCEILHKKLEK